jgi:hypothetical protein
MAKEKVVGKTPTMKSTPASRSSVEESFGSKPAEIPVGGGKMCTFGYKTGPETRVWPESPVSVDQKTGYPKGFDQRTKKA